jgi:uncharacterized protein
MHSSGNDAGDPPAEPIEVPYTELSADALRGVIENFVLREGTDYGQADVTLEQKVADVVRQLERREALIFYDPESESVTLTRA